MGEMKRLYEMLEEMFRPMCPTCGLVPKDKNSLNSGYCFYCEMPADWCQCETDHMCKCHGEVEPNMVITNQRIKSFMKDPTLYETVAMLESGKTFTAYSWAEGDDIQTAEDISIQFICTEGAYDERDFVEVSTIRVDK